MKALTKRLTTAETEYLAQCEEVIEAGLRTFVEVGTALAMVRDNRLYRSEFGTFEEYCSKRWNIVDSRARQLIMAAETVTTVTEAGLPAPANERQARELARVPDDQRAEVWRETVERTGGKPTAAAIRETASTKPAAAPAQDSPAGRDTDPPSPVPASTWDGQPGPPPPAAAGEADARPAVSSTAGDDGEAPAGVGSTGRAGETSATAADEPGESIPASPGEPGPVTSPAGPGAPDILIGHLTQCGEALFAGRWGDQFAARVPDVVTVLGYLIAALHQAPRPVSASEDLASAVRALGMSLERYAESLTTGEPL